jgi:L-2-hydroxyglutarate oxidase LhgO
MEVFEADAVVVGAGVVGLAVARALAMAGREVLILEKNAHFGEETSARNSEVIHAGIYYTPGSLKAQHCLAGRDRLYAYCQDRHVPHRRCGKLIVATDTKETAELTKIATRARANGVCDLALIDGEAVKAREPALRAEAALLSPSSGIIDSHAYMLALLGDAEAHGAQLMLRTPVLRGAVRDDGRVDLEIGGDAPVRLTARSFVNCAGLWAPALAANLHGWPAAPALSLVKGSYFALERRAPFQHLIYPVPRDGGLGVHLTLDMAGRAKFGPDTEWLAEDDPNRIDYRVSDTQRDAFVAAIRCYWPEICAEDLRPDYSGVRPKCAGADYPDFQILGPTDLPGHHAALYGIESPGLTASLSIAAQLADWLG